MSKKLKATDPARFEGNGISYRAKIIGIEDVTEARGDKMCQETIQKLKSAVKTSGQHKQRVFINVTLEGLKIIDGIAMTVLHTHPVHQISFISRDVTDSRAFGYIFGPGDGSHKFFGIKTANAAENVVLALRDLFQTVYEMKKQEIEDAKAKATAGTEGQGDGDNPDTTYQVPPNGQPAEGQESIYQGIEQIKNLEFDELTSEEAPRQPVSSSATTSPTSPATPAGNDPWGVSAPAATATATAPASSSLSDLQQLSNPPPISSPFGGMPAFPGTPAPGFGAVQPGVVQPGASMAFGVPGQQAMAQPGAALPVARDPFGDNPFTPPPSQAPQMMASPGAVPFGQQPGFGSPFPAATGVPAPGNPFPGVAAAAPVVPGMQPGFGVAAPAFTPFGVASPAPGMGMQVPPGGRAGGSPFKQPEENLLQPLKPGGQEEQAPPPPPGRAALFDDLLDIKKSGGAESAMKSPKEMFKELTQPPKKSLNEIKEEVSAAPKASDVFDQDPFAEDPFGSLDTVLNIVASSEPDPFFHVPPPSSSPPPLPPPALPPQPPAPPDPSSSSTRPDLTLSAPSSKESSPEAHFDMPDEPPPPLPSHLKVSLSAPSPPPRPPPVPSRPMPKPRKVSPSSPFPVSFTSPPPPLPTTPRPASSVASSSPASELSMPDTAPPSADTLKGARPASQGTSSAHSSPCVPIPHAPPSPSHSCNSFGTLSQSSSQKSLDRAVITVDSDDPFGVPLRSKKSFSSADGASKRSSRSSGKLSVKSDSKVPVAVDPFGVPLTDRTNSSEGSLEKVGVTNADNPFSVSAFDDVVSVTSSQGKWEAFGDHAANGVKETIKPMVVSSNGQRTDASPFGDSFVGAPVNANGKSSDAQS